MATMALPIRELGADVTIDAAAAQKKCLDVVESIQQSDFITSIAVRWKVHVLDFAFGKLMNRQQALLDRLQTVDAEHFTKQVFESLANDLDRIASLTYAVVDQANELAVYSEKWRAKLDKIAEHAAHIDNFAESFHIAADDACTDVLANVVAQMVRNPAIPA